MHADDVRQLVAIQIAGRWDETNWHRVNLRSALTAPTRCTMIRRHVRNGKITDTTVEGWIVLRERSADDGYLIFYDEVTDQFGLASSGFPEDRHPVVCGYYGDFWAAFQGM